MLWFMFSQRVQMATTLSERPLHIESTFNPFCFATIVIVVVAAGDFLFTSFALRFLFALFPRPTVGAAFILFHFMFVCFFVFYERAFEAARH